MRIWDICNSFSIYSRLGNWTQKSWFQISWWKRALFCICLLLLISFSVTIMFLRNNRNHIYVILSKSWKFLWIFWCIHLQIHGRYYSLFYFFLFIMFSVHQGDWIAQSVHGTIFTSSPLDINLDESFSLLNFSSFFLLFPAALFPWLTGYLKMSPPVLKCSHTRAGCYQHVSVKCRKFGTANISKTSFDLKLDAW